MLKHSVRILALLGATAAVALVWAGLTLAKPPKGNLPPGPSTGTVFCVEDDESRVPWITSVNWDGTGARRLYSGVVYARTGWDVSHSDTSTSHRFLIHDDPYDHGLYVVDLWAPDPSPRRIQGDASFWGTEPALSQDDTKVAFNGRGGGLAGLYVADLEKDEYGVPTGLGNVHRVAAVWDMRITWSPCGQYIAYARHRFMGTRDDYSNPEAFEIHVVSLTPDENGEYPVTNITNSPTIYETWPEWSPDLGGGTSRIAFCEGGKIYTVLPDGSDRRLVVSKVGFDSSSWSPDGLQIAFEVRRGTSRYPIQRTAADGSTSAVDVTGTGEYWGSVNWRPGP